MLKKNWFGYSSYTTKNLYKKKEEDSTLYTKNDLDSSESASAKSETPNHAFALRTHLISCPGLLKTTFVMNLKL
jgi:hypothetical protein